MADMHRQMSFEKKEQKELSITGTENSKHKVNRILNKIFHLDYLTLMAQIADQSIDFICIDPPYGKINGMKLSGQKENITWDATIDWETMFQHFNRVIKPGGTIAVFGQQPTYSKMILANVKDFKYELIWEKNNAAQGFNSDKMPLIYTENIAIFINNKKSRTFHKPNKTKAIDKTLYFNRWYAQQLFYFLNKTRRQIHRELGHRKLEFYFHFVGKHFTLTSKKNYDQLIEHYQINLWKHFLPYEELKAIWQKEKAFNKDKTLDSTLYNGTFKNIIKIAKDYKPYYHPTQKPLKLMELLVEMYSNKNEIVLDCFAGSGSTLIASKNKKRQFIGSELNRKYYEIALQRLADEI